MDLTSKLYSKTGKGTRALSTKPKGLPTGALKVLPLIDDKTTAAAILAKLDKFSETDLLLILARLERDGYIRAIQEENWDLDEQNTGYQTAMVVEEVSAADFFQTDEQHIADIDATADLAREEAERKAQEEEQAHRKAEADRTARLEAERITRDNAEREARAKAEAHRKAEESARLEAERLARAELERQAEEARRRAEAEMAARLKAERMAREAAEKQAREAEQARLKTEAEARALAEKTALMEAERLISKAAERKAHEEAEALRKAEAEKTARLEAERIAREAAEREARAAEELRLKAEAEARAAAEQAAHLEAERQAREEAERQARVAEQARLKAEADARAEAEKTAQLEAERIARETAERQAREAEEARHKAEAETRALAEKAARLEAEQLAREKEEARREAEAERAAREEAERQAQAAEEARLKAEADIRAEAEKTAQLEAERTAREAAERQAREAEEARIKAEARAHEERAARLEAERISREAAERETREEKEARRKAEVERKEREEAERQVRKAEEARRKAEADALRRQEKEQARALSAEKARQKTERKAQELVDIRARKRAAAIAKKRNAPDSGKRFATVVKTVSVYLPLALVLIVVALHFVNLAPFGSSIQNIASESLGEPVKFNDMRASLFPKPQLVLSGVTIGTDAEMKIASVRVVLALATLFDDRKSVDSLEIADTSLAMPELIRAQQWFRTSAQTDRLRIARVSLKNIGYTAPGLAPVSFDGRVDLLPTGEFGAADLTTSDRSLTLQLQPENDAWKITLDGSNWQPPLYTILKFDDVHAEGSIEGSKARFETIEGRIYGGTFTAKGMIDWAGRPTASGSFKTENIGLPQALTAAASAANLEGTLDATASFASVSGDPGKLVEVAEISARFIVKDGKIGGVDLTSAMLPANREKSTRFDTLTGNLQSSNGNYRYRNLVLESQQSRAQGNLDVQDDQRISGNVSVQLTIPSRRMQANIGLGGTVGDVRIR